MMGVTLTDPALLWGLVLQYGDDDKRWLFVFLSPLWGANMTQIAIVSNIYDLLIINVYNLYFYGNIKTDKMKTNEMSLSF